MKDFDRWVLVAPPEILCDFGKHLDPTLKDALAGELAKDLTKIPSGKILGHLHGVLPIFANSIEYFPSLWAASSIS